MLILSCKLLKQSYLQTKKEKKIEAIKQKNDCIGIILYKAVLLLNSI